MLPRCRGPASCVAGLRNSGCGALPGFQRPTGERAELPWGPQFQVGYSWFIKPINYSYKVYKARELKL